jgi:hypothetical protein
MKQVRIEEGGVLMKKTDPGYTPLAHQEDCDCCCGCDTLALDDREEDYPKDEEGNPIFRPL